MVNKMFHLISFSGGKSSGMMAKLICDKIPFENRIVVFCNTGKEHEATLEFVRDFELFFNIPITWLEYDNEEKKGYKVVNFNSASRKGEPFDKILQKKNFLPNPRIRRCTIELKIDIIKKFIKELGVDEYNMCVGLRYDEKRRVQNLKNNNINENYITIAPLYEMKITENIVKDFWLKQPFQLKIKRHFGNCDICFHKNINTLRHIYLEEPERFDWWIEKEEQYNATFHLNSSLKNIIKTIENSPLLFNDKQFETGDCFCAID